MTGVKKFFRRLLFEPPLCDDCGPLPVIHWQNQLNSFFEAVPPFFFVNRQFAQILNNGFINLFRVLRLLNLTADFDRKKISLRTTVFMEEAEKQGINFFALKSPLGYVNYFCMDFNGRRFLFEGLPRAEWLDTKLTEKANDKFFVKIILEKNGMPFAPGKAFSFLEKRRAFLYGRKLGYPLVVKPRFGSMSQHVTVNVQNDKELEGAINRALKYSPFFIIEKYVSGTDVYRATVIDGEYVACVKRMPAHVLGDGIHSIRELAEIKNQDPLRGNPKQKDITCFKLVMDETSERLLRGKGYSFETVPKKDELVYLQEKIILDLGSDLFEVTKTVHPDNLSLFRKIAEIFSIKVVGIDFLAEDIAKSWKSQNCAIIELNTLPYIDMHHFPTKGEPVKTAKWLCEMVKKYY